MQKLENFELLDWKLPIEQLCSDLSRSEYRWLENTKRQEFEGSAHRYTNTIFIRGPVEETVEAAMFSLDCEWKPALEDFYTSINEMINYTAPFAPKNIGRVMFVKLEPRAWIHWHSDEGFYAENTERYHISLQSDVGNVFLSERNNNIGEWVHMAPGELWKFNHRKPHALYNGSHRDRIHLIIDHIKDGIR